MLGVVGRGGVYAGRGGCAAPGREGADGRAVAGFADAAGGVGGGGCTMRGCVTCGRLAGASGRAGCGVLPGSSMRSRIVGGTNRPAGGGGAGAGGGAAATGAGGSSTVSSTTGGSSTGGASGTITIGGASSTSTVGGGSPSTTGGGGTTATGTSTGSCSTTGGDGGGGGGATAVTVSAAGACGLTVFTRRGGPRTGAAGLGGSAFFGVGAFLAVLFAGTACSANMSPLGSEILR